MERNPYEMPEHHEDCDGTYDSEGMCHCDYLEEDAFDDAMQSKIDQMLDK